MPSTDITVWPGMKSSLKENSRWKKKDKNFKKYLRNLTSTTEHLKKATLSSQCRDFEIGVNTQMQSNHSVFHLKSHLCNALVIKPTDKELLYSYELWTELNRLGWKIQYLTFYPITFFLNLHLLQLFPLLLFWLWANRYFQSELPLF